MLRAAFRAIAVVVACVATAWVVVQVLVNQSAPRRRWARASARPEAPRAAPTAAPSVALFSNGFIDDSGYNMAYPYIAPIEDRGDLRACLAAASGRADRGIAEIRGMLDRLGSARPRTPNAAMEVARLETYLALLHMYEGRFAEADRWIERAIADARTPGSPPDLAANLVALRGVAALRRGETENCVACIGPSSCILPIASEAVHSRPDGSRAAFGYFLEYLRQRPEDYGVRWLLNIAAMTLGEYPDEVPAEFRIALGPSDPGDEIGRFRNVATAAGLDVRGPNRSGGSIFDDFDGDGTFTDVVERAGVLNERWAHGAAWGDYDDDGRLDLCVSNNGAAGRLYHNNGDGTFADVAPALDVTGPPGSFACWFWDYDNDGRLDIYVNASFSSAHEVVLDALGRPAPGAFRPRLYRNLGAEGFRDVIAEAGLDHVWLSMGANVGDVDNDGYLDYYLGTGRPEYSALFPNVMLRNVGGRRFEDVTLPSGTGHLQKGHGVSFADYDADGDLDLFVETGGATPGDRAHNLLFQNPGNGRHWLAVRLVGTRSNRAALGAKIRVDLVGGPGATPRSVYRHIGPGSSFGGNGLTAWIGLDDARSAAAVAVEWPASGTRQTVRDVAADHTIEITEGVDGYRVLPRKAAPGPTHLGAG